MPALQLPSLQLTRERLGKRAFSVSSAAEHLQRAGDAGSLRQVLGAWDLTFLGTGSIIGAGVFVLSGVAANESAGWVQLRGHCWRCQHVAQPAGRRYAAASVHAS